MIKTIENYLDDVQKLFPYICKDDLRTIIDFGLSRYIKANRLHADVLLKNRIDDNMLIHCGRLTEDALQHWFRWHTKWRMKERVLYRFREETWDGYYYIGLNDERHNVVMQQHKKRKTFENVYLVKIKNELRHEKYVKHIWRIPYPMDCGWKFFVDKVSSDKAEYLGESHYEDYHQCFLGRFNDRYASANNKEQLADGCSECNTKDI